jgi:hypothetical protein
VREIANEAALPKVVDQKSEMAAFGKGHWRPQGRYAEQQSFVTRIGDQGCVAMKVGSKSRLRLIDTLRATNTSPPSGRSDRDGPNEVVQCKSGSETACS